MEGRELDSSKGQGPEIGSCEYGNGISVSIICKVINITFSNKILLRGFS